MKLRYIILGISLFVWSSVISEILIRYMDFDTVIGRPVIYFVLVGSGILIGHGLTRR